MAQPSGADRFRSVEMSAMQRRTFLRQAGLAAAIPFAAPTALGEDPDQLFRDGWFAAADHGYARILRGDPRNVHSLAQCGYIALLGNRFKDAETHLSRAVQLGDHPSRQWLAECLVRQDQHARAIPLLRGGGPRGDAYAELYAHLEGPAWQVSGGSSAVPFLAVDPVPSVMASVNGGPAKGFLLDTYSTLDLSPAAADEAGLTSVATITGVANNAPVVIHLGILESIRIGAFEVRNMPIQWTEGLRPPLPDGTQPAGVLGTTLFYHLLATMDYARQKLLLRRKSKCGQPGERLPLWLAGDHYPCTLGSLGDYGPRVVTLDTGGVGHGLDTTVEMADRAGIPVDYAHPVRPGLYPVTPDRISLGRAVGYGVNGLASEGPAIGAPGPSQAQMFGFTPIANFTHEFFKPYAITFDYTEMNVVIR